MTDTQREIEQIRVIFTVVNLTNFNMKICNVYTINENPI